MQDGVRVWALQKLDRILRLEVVNEGFLTGKGLDKIYRSEV